METVFGRIENGAVVEWARSIPAPVVPEATEENPTPQPIYQDWRPLLAREPEIDKRTHQLGDPVDTLEPNRIVRVWPVAERTIPAADLAAYAADLRWRMMEAGVVVSGVTLAATDAVILRLKTTADLIDSGVLAAPVSLVIGLVTLQADVATLRALAGACAQRMQDLFARQSNVVAGINAGSITNAVQIDAAMADPP